MSPMLKTSRTENVKVRPVPTHIHVLFESIAAPSARQHDSVGRIPAGFMPPDAKKRVAPTTHAEAPAAVAIAAFS